jgi:hypothetical protein
VYNLAKLELLHGELLQECVEHAPSLGVSRGMPSRKDHGVKQDPREIRSTMPAPGGTEVSSSPTCPCLTRNLTHK